MGLECPWCNEPILDSDEQARWDGDIHHKECAADARAYETELLNE